MTKKKITPDQLRSARWFAPDDLRSFGHRSRTMQMGYAPEEWKDRPIIAILNTWSDAQPCHMHFKSRVDDVKRGILMAGGLPIELPALSLSESLLKPTTMLYRNLLAMDAEELLRSHPVDGVVLMGGCDKTTPALLLGATSMNIPAIYLPAGPMLRGNWKGKTLGSGSDGWKYWDERRAGKISDKDWLDIEAGIARSYGTCMTMGTASTMTAIAEAIGMTLPGASSIPAADANHIRMASECGRRIVEMVWEDLTPKTIQTRKAFENAIAVAMAMGCSTNAIIHLIAQARRAGQDIGLDDFEKASRKVPVIANVRPSGDAYLMEDFFYAGGLPALMGQIKPHLHLDCITVTGQTVGENIEGAEVHNADVIRGRRQSHLQGGRACRAQGQSRARRLCHKTLRLCAALPQAYGTRAGVRRLSIDEEGGRRSQPGRYRGSHPHPAQCGAAGRARHAGMGHAADPDQAREAGCARHGANLGRAHERHQLRRLHSARLAGVLHRRPAGAGAERRSHHARRRRAHHQSRCERSRARKTPRRLEAARAPLRARLWLDVHQAHQAGQ
ncbi:dihydroxyacid dehydratase/phosphogluconate dehydratase [Bradyrhizobium japonicum]